MRRFYCPKISPIGTVLSLPEVEARHFATVLRGSIGDELKLLDGDGVIAIGVVNEVSGSRKNPDVKVEIISYENVILHTREVCLYVACPRTKQMELILRQATELGVTEIHPIITEYTVSRPDKNPEKWNSVLIEAMKQSGNPFLPKLAEVCSFDEALAANECPEIGFYGAVPAAGEEGLKHSISGEEGRVAFWVGPEGGFSSEELEALRSKVANFENEVSRSFLPLTIGHHILRIETACTAGTAVIMAL